MASSRGAFRLALIDGAYVVGSVDDGKPVTLTIEPCGRITMSPRYSTGSWGGASRGVLVSADQTGQPCPVCGLFGGFHEQH